MTENNLKMLNSLNNQIKEVSNVVRKLIRGGYLSLYYEVDDKKIIHLDEEAEKVLLDHYKNKLEKLKKQFEES